LPEIYRDEEFHKKVTGLLELPNKGIAGYHNLNGEKRLVTKDGNRQDGTVQS
jgi:hypothetical protein